MYKGVCRKVAPLNELNMIDNSLGEKRVGKFRSKNDVIGKC